MRRRIRHADLAFLIAAGADEARLAFAGGAVVEAEVPPTLSIRMDGEAWAAFRTPVPPPGSHHFGAMAKTGRARIEGD
ncbi:hypothetical protein [Sphingomonas sp.]|uniref:hypothetical protein n=1 Tax=Sphingomonas sp. TaxID=28214 RepID=UPI003CC55548